MPIARVQMPDGRIARFEVAEGTSPQEVESAALEMSQKAAQPSLPERLVRQVGLTGRAALQGGLSLAAIPGDLMGMDSSGAVARLGDLIGLPRPENSTERVAGDVAGAMAGQGALSKGLGLIKDAGGPVLRGITELLGRNQGAQIVGAAGAGAGSGSARESGMGPVGQTVAGLIGGVAAPIAADATIQAGKAAVRGIGAAVAPFTEAGRKAVVGTTLRRLASDPDTAIANIDAAPDYVQGSNPTSAQAARDPGLLNLERGIASANPQAGAKFEAAKSQQNSARNAVLNAMALDEKSLKDLKSSRATTTKPFYEKALAEKSFADPQQQDKALSISQFVAKEGGLKKSLVGGDLNEGVTELPIGLTAKGLGIRKIVHEGATAKSPDRMLGRLIEDGYLSEQAGINDMYALLDDELAAGVKRHMSVNDIDAVLSARAGAKVPENKILSDLEKRPSFQQAIKRATDIAAEDGINIGDPTKSIKGLHYIKMALDDIIERSAGVDSGIGKTQRRSIIGTKETLLNEMDRISPDYEAAHITYNAMSKPINQMETLQTVRGQVQNAGTDAASGERILSAAKFANILKNPDRVAELRKVLTPEQFGNLERISADLDRAALSSSSGRAAGSNTTQNISTAYVLGKALGGDVADNVIIRNLSRPLQWLNKLNEKEIQELLTDAMLNPGMARSLMAKPTTSNVESLGLELVQRARALGIGAASSIGVSQNRQEAGTKKP